MHDRDAAVAAGTSFDPFAFEGRHIGPSADEVARMLEVVRAFEAASVSHVPFEILARRDGDVAELVADASRARQVLAWRATRGIETMCLDTWRSQRGNANAAGDAR